MTLDLQNIIRNEFPKKNVLIVGDLVADQFLQGTITRVSREAPVFILRHDQTETVPGSAANAAANVASLGGGSTIVGVVGSDDNGNALRDKLTQMKVNCDHVFVSDGLRTTTKVRVLAGQEHAARQQVIRIDYEDSKLLPSEAENALIDSIRETIKTADAVILSDYNYGVASAGVTSALFQLSQESGVPLVVDSRFHLGNFKGAASATPNQDEVEQIARKRFTDVGELETFCTELRAKLDYKALMVTRGPNGIMLVEENAPVLHLPAIGSKDPVDVTGAGDTVIAAYALGLASGLSFADAARVANHAGGIVVMKRSTAAVTAAELIASIEAEARSTSANC